MPVARMIAVGCAAVVALSGCASAPAAQSISPPSITRSAPSPTPTDIPVGTPFDDVCSVAWPTAPVRSVDSVQVRYSCRALPTDEYLFVLAVYPGPDLEVPAGADPVEVHGVVSGSATTPEGYRMLIVDAVEH